MDLRHCSSAPLFRLFSAAVLVCVFGAAALRADEPVKNHKENRRAESHQIETMEQTWLRALQKSDTAQLERMMSDDFLAISANGTLSDKQQYLARLGSRLNVFSNIELMDMKVRMQPSAAVVVSQVRVLGELDGHPVNGIYRYTKVYGRGQNGQWRVLNLEATRVSTAQPDDMGMHRGMPLNWHHEH